MSSARSLTDSARLDPAPPPDRYLVRFNEGSSYRPRWPVVVVSYWRPYVYVAFWAFGRYRRLYWGPTDD